MFGGKKERAKTDNRYRKPAEKRVMVAVTPDKHDLLKVYAFTRNLTMFEAVDRLLRIAFQHEYNLLDEE